MPEEIREYFADNTAPEIWKYQVPSGPRSFTLGYLLLPFAVQETSASTVRVFYIVYIYRVRMTYSLPDGLCHLRTTPVGGKNYFCTEACYTVIHLVSHDRKEAEILEISGDRVSF